MPAFSARKFIILLAAAVSPWRFATAGTIRGKRSVSVEQNRSLSSQQAYSTEASVATNLSFNASGTTTSSLSQQAAAAEAAAVQALDVLNKKIVNDCAVSTDGKGGQVNATAVAAKFSFDHHPEKYEQTAVNLKKCAMTLGDLDKKTHHKYVQSMQENTHYRVKFDETLSLLQEIAQRNSELAATVQKDHDEASQKLRVAIKTVQDHIDEIQTGEFIEGRAKHHGRFADRANDLAEAAKVTQERWDKVEAARREAHNESESQQAYDAAKVEEDPAVDRLDEGSQAENDTAPKQMLSTSAQFKAAHDKHMSVHGKSILEDQEKEEQTMREWAKEAESANEFQKNNAMSNQVTKKVKAVHEQHRQLEQEKLEELTRGGDDKKALVRGETRDNWRDMDKVHGKEASDDPGPVNDARQSDEVQDNSFEPGPVSNLGSLVERHRTTKNHGNHASVSVSYSGRHVSSPRHDRRARLNGHGEGQGKKGEDHGQRHRHHSRARHN